MIHAGANQSGSKEPRPSGRGLGLRRGLLGVGRADFTYSLQSIETPIEVEQVLHELGWFLDSTSYYTILCPGVLLHLLSGDRDDVYVARSLDGNG